MSSRILVVEDNHDLAENLRELLEELGADVSIAARAEDAERLMASHAFDLAIMDVNLPDESGIALVPRLRANSPHADAVLVTGDATIGSAIEAVRHGVFAYVQKPFDPDDLLALVERALSQAALRRERAELAAELARSEALYHDVVDSVHSLLVGLDAEHRIALWNRTIAETTGWTAHEALGRDAGELLFDPEHRAPFREALQGARKTAVALPVRVRTGPPRIVRWRAAPLAGVAQVLAVGEDVTERLALEARTAEAEAMAAMGRLTAALAHEIRNPLNAAALQLELVARAAARLAEDTPREQLVHRTAIVRSELTRLTQLLDEFLALARPSSGAVHAVDAAAILEQLAEIQAPLARAAGVTLRVEVDERLPLVRGDGAKLKQALLNLLVNAIDAIGDRGHGDVVLGARRDGDRVELRVEDDGPGLPPVSGDLFRAFVTTKEKGTGLGLAIVKQIAEQHGGVVALRPRAEGGTVALLQLPAA